MGRKREEGEGEGKLCGWNGWVDWVVKKQECGEKGRKARGS